MDGITPAPAGAVPSLLMHLLDEADEGERSRHLRGLLSHLRFDWLAWGPVHRRADAAVMAHGWQCLGAQSWHRRYRDQAYERLDPRLHACLESRLPVLWQLDGLSRHAGGGLRRFVDDLASTGMQSGAMLALDGRVADERLVVSVLSQDPDTGLAADDARLGQLVTLGLCLRELKWHPAAPSPTGPCAGPAPINRTQQAILQYLAGGLADKQIAARLALSLHTVDYHMRQLRKRFGARNRVQLVQAAGGPPSPEVHSSTE